MIRVGGSVAGDLSHELWGAPLAWEAFGSTMQFFGDDLFLERQNELGASLNRVRMLGGEAYTALGLSASTIFGGDGSYEGASIRIFGHF